MSFRKHRPYRKAVRLGKTEPLAAFHPSEVPEGARDGLFRLVHARRAAKLRKRGVVLDRVEEGVYAWFEHGESFIRRQMQRDLAAAFRKAARSGPLYFNDAGFERVKGMVRELVAPYGRPPCLEVGLQVDIGHGLDRTVHCLFDALQGTHGSLAVIRDEGESDQSFRERVAAYIMDQYPEYVPDFTKVREPMRPASEFYDVEIEL